MKNTTPILPGIASPDKVETCLGILKIGPAPEQQIAYRP
jgi:hypothetical protein